MHASKPRLLLHRPGVGLALANQELHAVLPHQQQVAQRGFKQHLVHRYTWQLLRTPVFEHALAFKDFFGSEDGIVAVQRVVVLQKGSGVMA